MHNRANRHRILDHVHTHIRHSQFVHQWQTLKNSFFTEVAHIHQYTVPPGSLDRIAFLLFVPEGLAQAVTRAKFHRLEDRLTQGCFRTHIVILQIAVAIFIDQYTTLTPAAFGEQNSRTWQTGWMILNKLHILKRHTGAICHGHAITCLDRTVSGERKNLTGAT